MYMDTRAAEFGALMGSSGMRLLFYTSFPNEHIL